MVALLISLSLTAYAGVSLANLHTSEEEQIQAFEALREDIHSGNLEDGDNEDKSQSPYKKVFTQNKDMAAWLTIQGTNIDFPVMQSEQADYYLNHDFQKKESAFGTPYLDSGCQLQEETNLLIYGHNVRNKQMFGALQDYTDVTFAKKHSQIQLDFLNFQEIYQVVGVFTTRVKEGEDASFDYRSGILFENQKQFSDFWRQYREKAVVSLQENISMEDKFLMLSTCEYTHEDGRLVVLARRVSKVEYEVISHEPGKGK